MIRRFDLRPLPPVLCVACGIAMVSAASLAQYAPPGCAAAASGSGYDWVCEAPPPEGALPDQTRAFVRSDPRCQSGPSLHSAGNNWVNPATGHSPSGASGRTVQCQGQLQR
jgi:hypothetical protein